MLAQQLILLCGQKELTWDVVSFVRDRFQESMRGNIFNYLPSSFRLDVKAMIWGNAFDIQCWRDSALKVYQGHGELLPIYFMITYASGLKASNPRDYIYGIMTTGTEWHFIIYTSDGIYSISGSEYQINLMKLPSKKILNYLEAMQKG